MNPFQDDGPVPDDEVGPSDYIDDYQDTNLGNGPPIQVVREFIPDYIDDDGEDTPPGPVVLVDIEYEHLPTEPGPMPVSLPPEVKMPLGEMFQDYFPQEVFVNDGLK